MEFLLLWVDELDDFLGTLRHLAPTILGFLAAVALFVGTGFALVRMPQPVPALIALLLSAALLEAARRRRARLARAPDAR